MNNCTVPCKNIQYIYTGMVVSETKTLIQVSKAILITHWPHTSVKSHWVRHSISKIGRTKDESVVTNKPSAVSTQWTVVGISIIGCR